LHPFDDFKLDLASIRTPSPSRVGAAAPAGGT